MGQRQKELLERSLAIKEKHYGAGHISTAVTLNNLATAYTELGDVVQEREMLERSLSIKEQHYGKGSVQCAATLANLASVYSELGDTRRGLEVLKDTVAIEERHFGPGHVETAITLNNLALACGETGDLQSMRDSLLQSLEIKENYFGAGHPESCLVLANLGMACSTLGDNKLAQEYCRRALAACEQEGNPNSRRYIMVCLRVAITHCACNDSPKADQLTTSALRALVNVVGSTSATRTLKREVTRCSRIWSVAAREDVLRWMKTTWTCDRLAPKATP